jgi:ADP-ribose pyrophosphatase YjhB (NUDIX family)
MSGWARLRYRAARLWWSITKPITVGVRVFLIQEEKLLLVRHTYQDAWYLVGGGVQGGETLEQAIRREAAEEVGADLGALRLFGIYSSFYEGKSDHVIVFVCTEFTLTGVTDREIERFAFFTLDDLPEGTSPGTRRRVQEYTEDRIPCAGMW